jgi:hypothetical protein
VAEGLRTLFATPAQQLSAMGERGRALVAKRFAWPRLGSEMEAVYQWILGGGTAPACIVDF